jgi:hypothetical protein
VEPQSPPDQDDGGACSGPDGVVVARQVRPSIYTVFASSRDAFHGHQWVGYRGGTGAQATARLVRVPEGTTVTIPDIRLDHAGTLTGTMTDEATGQPIKWGLVAVSSLHGRRGGGGPAVNTDEAGRYTFEGLGPYKWTLFETAFGYGSQFTGGVANRFLSGGVQVRADQTTTYDIALSTGTTLIVNLLGADGQPAPADNDVVIVNALTGDEMGRAMPDVDPPYQRQVKAPQLVKLRIEGGIAPTWVGGADFIHATVFLISATGTKTIDVTVP